MELNDKVWQGNDLTQRYLNGVRGAIPMAPEQMDMMLRLVNFSQESVTAVLDLGCGDGILGQAVLDQFPEAEGTFVDFSAPMLEAAKRRLADYEDRVKLVNADYGKRNWMLFLSGVEGLEIRDGRTHKVSNLQSPISNCFEVIVSGYSIHHQPDGRKQTLYRELFDLLTPGGIFINIEHVASRSKWGEMLFEEAFVDSMVAYHKGNGSQQSRAQIAHDLYNRPDKEANILTPVETQCDWLREFGFIHVDCYLKYFELALFAGVKPM